MKSVKFKSVLFKPDDGSGWHFIKVAASYGSKFEKKDGSRRVVCTINGIEPFQCALLHPRAISSSSFNKAKRDRLKIAAGDEVSVELTADYSKYGLPMPDELRAVLNQDPDGDRLFHSLTPGKQRNILHFIGKIKNVDKRIHTALVFIEHMKNNDGKFIYEQLQEELKRPLY